MTATRAPSDPARRTPAQPDPARPTPTTTRPSRRRPDQTLADVVTAAPSSAPTLERHGLDYCCGGGRTLQAACDEAGVDVDTVLRDLDTSAATGPAPAWAAMAPDELVDHIEQTHHIYLKAALPRLDQLAAKVAGVHGGRHPELAAVAALVRELRADLEPHLAKEEQVLFPMIRELVGSTTAPAFHCGTLRNPITQLMIEHDQAGELLAALRDRTAGFVVPADGCASYRALYDGLTELEEDTHLHVHKENNLLFPAVVALEAERAT